MVVLTGLATLGVVAYLASQLWAQTPGTAPASAPPSVKIGLVNLAYIFKGYNKYKTYSDEMEKIRVVYETKDKQFRTKIKEYQDYAMKPGASQADKDKMEEYAKIVKRQIEDNVEEAKKVASKTGDEHMIQCYKEIEEAVKRYSAANGFHIIFSYSEALTEAEKYTKEDVQRKITGTFSSGGVSPFYFVGGIDVSADVVSLLNTMYQVPAAAAPATAPGGGPKN